QNTLALGADGQRTTTRSSNTPSVAVTVIASIAIPPKYGASAWARASAALAAIAESGMASSASTDSASAATIAAKEIPEGRGRADVVREVMQDPRVCEREETLEGVRPVRFMSVLQARDAAERDEFGIQGRPGSPASAIAGGGRMASIDAMTSPPTTSG